MNDELSESFQISILCGCSSVSFSSVQVKTDIGGVVNNLSKQILSVSQLYLLISRNRKRSPKEFVNVYVFFLPFISHLTDVSKITFGRLILPASCN